MGGQATALTPTDSPPDAGVRPPGQYYATTDADSTQISAYFRKSDETGTFRLTYDVANAAQRYSDTAELYWQFIGDQWEVPVSDVTITIKPPVALTKDEVKAWAHGPLTGTVRIADDGVVTLKVPRVPPQTFVEARVLYPPTALPDAPVIDQPRKQTVLDEEAKWANEANASASRPRPSSTSPSTASACSRLRRSASRSGRSSSTAASTRRQFQGQYFREDPRPDLPPSVVGALFRFGKVENSDIAATLMNLADKGIISMQPVQETKSGIFGAKEINTYELSMVPGKEPESGSLDANLCYLIFSEIGSGAPVRLEDIKAYAKDNAKEFSESIQQWKDNSSAQADQLGLMEAGGSVVAGRADGAGHRAGSRRRSSRRRGPGRSQPRSRQSSARIAILIISRFMQRRSQAGAELNAQYVALRNFLKDFSRLERGAARVGRALEPVPGARGGLRHRRGGHRAAQGQGARGRQRSRASR